MKKLLVIFMIAFGLQAYAVIDCVVVYDIDEHQNIIPIKDASDISFDGNIISIGSYSFNMLLLKRYEFSDSSSLGIEEIGRDLYGLKIDPKGLITFDEALSRSSIELCDAKGIPQPYILNGNTIDFRELPSGIYIIKIGLKTIKLLKL